MKPLLISDSLDSSLARLYDKLVLDEHYANLYGPAAAAETKKVDISATGEVRPAVCLHWAPRRGPYRLS